MDPDPAFEDADPFAGLEARLADSFDDELTELDYARTDEQAQAELEATMERLRRRAAEPRQDDGPAPGETEHPAAGVDPGGAVARPRTESRTPGPDAGGSGLQILDEHLDLDVDYEEPIAAPVSPSVQRAESGSGPGQARAAREAVESTNPALGTTVPQPAFAARLAESTSAEPVGVQADPDSPIDPNDQPLFVASGLDSAGPTSTFGEMVTTDGANSPLPPGSDDRLLPVDSLDDEVEWGLDDLGLPGPSSEHGEDLFGSEPGIGVADLDIDGVDLPSAQTVSSAESPLVDNEPTVEVGLAADDLARAADPAGAPPAADGQAAPAVDAKPIPGVRIPETRLATPEQMAIADATPVPRLPEQTADGTAEKVILGDEESDPAARDDSDAIEHLIPDRERPPLLVYLLLTALTLAALGALLWYTNRSATDTTAEEGTPAEVSATADSDVAPVVEDSADAAQEQPAPAMPAGTRIDAAANQIATAVDRCDSNGLLGTLRSSADVPVQVDLRLEFVDEAGQIYYTAERATGAIDPGQAVRFSFLLLGEPLDAQYVGVEPADCRFNITGVFGA